MRCCFCWTTDLLHVRLTCFNRRWRMPNRSGIVWTTLREQPRFIYMCLQAWLHLGFLWWKDLLGYCSVISSIELKRHYTKYCIKLRIWDLWSTFILWYDTLTTAEIILNSLKAVTMHVSDLDECADGPAICSHLCVNTRGSFRCDCDNGYVLGPNAAACEGLVQFTL